MAENGFWAISSLSTLAHNAIYRPRCENCSSKSHQVQRMALNPRHVLCESPRKKSGFRPI
ncbi:hypothetical protein TYRP_021831 [Tyrophagus putrescentiae]|nr:hypothetical protein TYRP_021831 [Tyrophagus putrescentiae]